MTSLYWGAIIALLPTSQPRASKRGSISDWRTWASLTPGARNAWRLVVKYRHKATSSSFPWSIVLVIAGCSSRLFGTLGFAQEKLQYPAKGTDSPLGLAALRPLGSLAEGVKYITPLREASAEAPAGVTETPPIKRERRTRHPGDAEPLD